MILPSLALALLTMTMTTTTTLAERRSPRVVTTKYGKLRGSIRELRGGAGLLRPVEVFLGVPYATPPTGSNRFSPTRTPNHWSGERRADQFGPVCPQHLPEGLWEEAKEGEANGEAKGEASMPRQRLMHIRRLANYLTHQAEDCLYLNVYVPSLVADTTGHRALPVVVYIHGESFEWGASNPYDGSVLAAYGQVIVITLNYRLGPLGFLNTNADPSGRGHIMNHGLMDQIAALHWVQENVGAFGGDPGSVTLVGHGTGAACVHFLMTSAAVVPGLFHRAVLMSGSALSSWATVGTPTHFALRFGRALNCTGGLLLTAAAASLRDPELAPSDEQLDRMVNCLKERPLEDLQAVHVDAPQFLYAFGPSVDGIVIRSDYRRELRRRAGDAASAKGYDVLFGVVPRESFGCFSDADVEGGLDAGRRDRLLRTLVRNAYDFHLNEVFISVVNEYTEWETPQPRPDALRDAAMDALSDARYVAPLLGAAEGLRTADKSQFFYVFDHTKVTADNPHRLKGAVHGEELPFAFGAPLVGELGVFAGNWSRQDQMVSEAMLTYLTNFAKTGNPNFLKDQDMLINVMEKGRFLNLKWDEYDPVYQKYLLISSRPRQRDHYRAHQLALWTWLIPQLQRVGRQEFLILRDPETEDLPPEDQIQELSVVHHLFSDHDDPGLYSGRVRPLQHMAGHYVLPSTTTTTTTTPSLPATTTRPSSFPRLFSTPRGGRGGRPRPPGGVEANVTAHAEATMPEGVDYVAYSTALSVTIAIGVSLLILNILIFAGVYYQRDRSRLGDKHQQQHQQQQHQQHQQGNSHSSSSEQQMAAISSASDPMLVPALGLEAPSKAAPTAKSSLKAPPPSPLADAAAAFAHLSECPPAFADAPVGEAERHCVVAVAPPTIPNGSATILGHQQHLLQQKQMSLPRPPPPPRLLPAESQPLLPVNVPAPPRGKIPPYEELRV